MRGWVADRRGSSVEKRKGICTKGWKFENGNNPVTL